MDRQSSQRKNTVKILFVCLGNICRSPTAEGVLRALIQERGLEERLQVDSAGTLSYHSGNSADSRMMAAAERRGWQLGSRARQVRRADFVEFDWVIAMDRSNFLDLEDLAPPGLDSKIKLFCDFLPEAQGQDVPDPYYGGAEGFERVLDLVEEGCEAVLEAALKKLRLV